MASTNSQHPAAAASPVPARPRPTRVRRSLLKLLLLSAAFGLAADPGPAVAQATSAYPTKPVRIFVPFAAGGAVDIMGRTMAQLLSDALGQPFVVENRPGTGGLLALQAAASAEPNGYTLVVGSAGPLSVSPTLFRNQQFDPRERLEPVIWFVNTPGIIVARKDLAASTPQQLIEQSKAKPGELNMASAGTGSILHLMGELFQDRMGIKWTHVPYKGSSPALVDLVAGRVDVMVDVVPTAAPYVKSGQIKPIAVTTPKRSAMLPDVPTLEELGVRGFDMGSWMALMAPKGTPPAVVERLNSALNKALESKELQQKLVAMGAEPEGGTPQRLAQKIVSELETWAKIIDSAGVEAR